MRKVIKIGIIRASKLEEFVEEINWSLDRGWELHGDMVVNKNNCYVQLLARYSEPTSPTYKELTDEDY